MRWLGRRLPKSTMLNREDATAEINQKVLEECQRRLSGVKVYGGLSDGSRFEVRLNEVTIGDLHAEWEIEWEGDRP